MSQSELGELYRLIRELTSRVSDLTVAVARVEERMKPTVALEERVKELELDRAKVQGIGLAGKAIWAFIGAGGIGVLVSVVLLIRSAGH